MRTDAQYKQLGQKLNKRRKYVSKLINVYEGEVFVIDFKQRSLVGKTNFKRDRYLAEEDAQKLHLVADDSDVKNK